MNPYIIIAALVGSIALTAGGYTKGRIDANSAWELKAAAAAEDAHKREIELQGKANEITNQLQSERDRIAGELDHAIEQLRRRPERLPEPARVACKGSTGAELSGRDAIFLERLAARADRTRAALEACYQWIDAVSAAHPVE